MRPRSVLSGWLGLATSRASVPFRADRTALTPDTDPRTGKPRAGFETAAQCRAEDRGRALALGATPASVAAILNGTRPAPRLLRSSQAKGSSADTLSITQSPRCGLAPGGLLGVCGKSAMAPLVINSPNARGPPSAVNQDLSNQALSR